MAAAVSSTLARRFLSASPGYLRLLSVGATRLPNCPLPRRLATIVNRPIRVMYSNTRPASNQMASTTDGLLFRQLFESISSTYTYLLADASSKEAILIDPVYETVERDVKLVADLGLTLKYVINTHVHADHVTGSGEIKKRIPGCQSVIGGESGAKADLFMKHKESLKFGKFSIEFRRTPGHTNGCMSLVLHEMGCAFTGDALLVRGCGRTDFQEGDPGLLYECVHREILSLPDNFLLYPAHDYKGQTVTSVDEEKRLNPRLTKSKAEFIEIMTNLNLSPPKQIDRAVPANMVCGCFEV